MPTSSPIELHPLDSRGDDYHLYYPMELTNTKQEKSDLSLLELNVKSVSNGKRIGASHRDKRDLLLYMLWKTGRFSNKEIGSHFSLSYSAVSQRAKIMSLKISKKKELQN